MVVKRVGETACSTAVWGENGDLAAKNPEKIAQESQKCLFLSILLVAILF
jgi:hypothetical protein